MKFKELQIWHDSINVILEVYELTGARAFQSDYNLRNQIRKSAVSVNSNIVEGYERDSQKEFARFLKIAKGSLGELYTQLIIAEKLSYISKLDSIESDIIYLSNKIGKLIKIIYSKL